MPSAIQAPPFIPRCQASSFGSLKTARQSWPGPPRLGGPFGVERESRALTWVEAKAAPPEPRCPG